MSTQDMHVAAPGLPRVSPSRLEAWDRCPAAYRFEYVLRLPQPIGDQRPRRLGSVAHALLEDYLQEASAGPTRSGSWRLRGPHRPRGSATGRSRLPTGMPLN
jgi:PD-(D/E)XK nuclease superfamily